MLIQYVKASDLLNLTNYKDLKPRLYNSSKNIHKIFVSHAWINGDPFKDQKTFEKLISSLPKDSYVWIDYYCSDQTNVDLCMKNVDKIISECDDFIILEDEHYFTRLWCYYEYRYWCHIKNLKPKLIDVNPLKCSNLNHVQLIQDKLNLLS